MVVLMVDKKPQATRVRGKKFVSYYKRTVTLDDAIHPTLDWRNMVRPLPDLVVVRYADEYLTNTREYKVKATIANIGKKKSGKTTAYCNAISLVPHPGLNEIRIQKDANVKALEPRHTVEVEFEPFKLADMHANEVGKIQIEVDPKRMVKELNEANNVVEWYWPY
jgi:subtilase family serine protease